MKEQLLRTYLLLIKWRKEDFMSQKFLDEQIEKVFQLLKKEINR